MDSWCACARRAAVSSSSGAGRRAAGASRRSVAERRGLGESRLRLRERVRSAADFRRAFRKGLRFDGALFTLLAVANQLEVARIGLAAGRRVGNAAVRNRAKRLLRETFRRNKSDLIRGLDLIL